MSFASKFISKVMKEEDFISFCKETASLLSWNCDSYDTIVHLNYASSHYSSALTQLFPNALIIDIDCAKEAVTIQEEKPSIIFHHSNIEDSVSFSRMKTTKLLSFQCFVCLKDQKTSFKVVYDMLKENGSAAFCFLMHCPYFTLMSILSQHNEWKQYVKLPQDDFASTFFASFPLNYYKKILEMAGFKCKAWFTSTKEILFSSADEMKDWMYSNMEFKNSLPECCKTRFQNETFEIYKMIRGKQGFVIPLISAEFFVTKEKEGAINTDNFTSQSLYSLNVEYPLDLKNKALNVTLDINSKSAPLIPIINDQFFVRDSEIEKSNKHSFSEEIPSENPQSIPTINKYQPSTRDKISHLTSKGNVHLNDRTEQLENIENLPPENQDITTECKKTARSKCDLTFTHKLSTNKERNRHLEANRSCINKQLYSLNKQTPEFSVSQFRKSTFDNISPQSSPPQITSNKETSHSVFDQISPPQNYQLPTHKDLSSTSTQLMLSQEKNQCPMDQIYPPQAGKVIPSLLTQTAPASQSDQPLQYQIQPSLEKTEPQKDSGKEFGEFVLSLSKIACSPPSSSCSPLSPTEFTVADYTLYSPVGKFRYPPRPYSPSRRNLNSPARRSLFSNRNPTQFLPDRETKKSSLTQPNSSK